MRACVLFAMAVGLFAGSPATAQEAPPPLNLEESWGVQDLPSISSQFEPEDSWSVDRDDTRLTFSYQGTVLLARSRDVYYPTDGLRIRHETVYLGQAMDYGPHFGFWSSRERQDIPGGPKATSYGVAMIWRF